MTVGWLLFYVIYDTKYMLNLQHKIIPKFFHFLYVVFKAKEGWMGVCVCGYMCNIICLSTFITGDVFSIFLIKILFRRKRLVLDQLYFR